MSRFGRAWVGAVMVAAWMVAGGCSSAHTDPRFEQRSAKRLERIAATFARLDAREAECAERLAHVARLAEDGRVRHERNLARTLEVLERQSQREIDLWPDRLARTRAVVTKELAGDVESIDAIIPRMFY